LSKVLLLLIAGAIVMMAENAQRSGNHPGLTVSQMV